MSDRELLSEAWKALLAAERQQADWSRVRDLRRRIETRMGEPSEGIDSLRKALSIADEKGRALTTERDAYKGMVASYQDLAAKDAERIERLTADRDLHKAYAVESQRRFDEAKARLCAAAAEMDIMRARIEAATKRENEDAAERREQAGEIERLRQQLAEAMQTGPCDAGWPALIEFAADLNASDKALRRIAEAQGREFFDRGWQDTTAAEVLSFSPADAEYHELMHGEMTRSAEHWKTAAIKWVQQRDRAVAELNRQIAARDSAGEDARRLLVERGAMRAEVAHLREGIAIYQHECDEQSKRTEEAVDAWRERDRTRASQQTTEGKPHA